MTAVTVGHDVRHWTTFEVRDATEEERAVLESGDDAQALALLRGMDQADRLTFAGDDSDDMPEFFGESSSVVGVVA